MSFFTDKKTLLVGALSLISSVSAVTLTTQANISSVPFFTESGSTPQMLASHSAHQEQSYILQGLGRDALVSAVERVGGAVSREFPIINAISAYLSSSQADELAGISGLHVSADRSVMTMSLTTSLTSDLTDALNTTQTKTFTIDNDITTLTQADKLHDRGLTGSGITVAIIDSGASMGGDQGQHLLRNQYGELRALGKYNAHTSTENRVLNDDKNGHGSHVTGIIASSLKSDNGKFNGMAPDAYVLPIKAFDAAGNGSYTDILDGLNFVYQNRSRFNIRVLNLSLGASVQSNYWNDPINQAVMRLWDAGIVVVTSVGNEGSDYATVTVPGNNPYIITVGAVTDSYTPSDASDDRMITFSSKGPTVEGFVKPEVVAYGGHISSKMNKDLLRNQNYVESETGEDYHMVSGTSQAAAVVTGTVALMLQRNPNLTPDDIKCRLIDSAASMADPSSGEEYGPFTQGAGLINAYAAVISTASGCANVGLDIQADLNGVTHFKGPARVTEQGQLLIALSNGEFVIEGSVWDGSTRIQGSVWDGSTRIQGSVWDGSTRIQGSIWDGLSALEGSVWDGSTILQGSVWDGHSVLEGSVWDGSTRLQGSVWDGLSSLEGSVWDGSSSLQGSVWDAFSNIEGSVWDTLTNLEGTAWDSQATLESEEQAIIDESVVIDEQDNGEF